METIVKLQIQHCDNNLHTFHPAWHSTCFMVVLILQALRVWAYHCGQWKITERLHDGTLNTYTTGMQPPVGWSAATNHLLIHYIPMRKGEF